MAATEILPPAALGRRPGSTPAATLQTLTAAALVLPGLLLSPAQAADAGDSLDLQYSRYEEGERDLINVDSGLKPLTADTIHAAGTFNLRDSIGLLFNFSQDTWSGATPVTTSPLLANGNQAILKNAGQSVITAGASPYVNGQVRLDSRLRPITLATDGSALADTRNVLVMSSASPEVRKQGDFSLAYEDLQSAGGQQGALMLGAGFSDEPDYQSRYGSVSGRLDFNQKLTSLNFGAAYTQSSTKALLDADLLPYLGRGAYASQLERYKGSELLRGKRSDRSANVGLTQVIDAKSLFTVNLGLTDSSGFMENPYKAMTVVFIAPDAFISSAQQSVMGDVRALLEQRPDQRRQLAVSGQYIRQVGALDAALHVDYQYSNDDWGIEAHSIEVAWIQPIGDWTLTPRLRYYTQQAADFYQPLLVSRQFYRSVAQDSAGREIWLAAADPQTRYFRSANGNFVDADGIAIDPGQLNLQPQFTGYDAALLPADFSSDHRLAGFGAVSAGLTLSRSFARGLTVKAGLEYYTRASGLKTGSTGDSGFADFDFAMANIAFQIDLQATPRRLRREAAQSHAQHAAHEQHVGHQAPSGLLFSHTLTQAGEFMMGYRVNHVRQDGAMRSGTQTADDPTLVTQGCSTTVQCRYIPTSMTMTMHMLDLMYAPTDRLTLMLMPQFMSMDMQLRELAGRPAPVPGLHEHGSGGTHASGALGDTVLAALFTLRQASTNALHASLGLSAPTGKVNLAYRRSFRSDGGLQHFDMQTGSGTWDLLPALTWSGMRDNWHWGLQLNGTKRLENRNASGYRLGNVLQVSGWLGHPLAEWLSASLRAVYTNKGDMAGDFTVYNARSGPMDFPANQGGRFWDIGLGFSASLAGSEVALEWLQPLQDAVTGYQLERQGALSASWRYGF